MWALFGKDEGGDIGVTKWLEFLGELCVIILVWRIFIVSLQTLDRRREVNNKS